MYQYASLKVSVRKSQSFHNRPVHCQMCPFCIFYIQMPSPVLGPWKNTRSFPNWPVQCQLCILCICYLKQKVKALHIRPMLYLLCIFCIVCLHMPSHVLSKVHSNIHRPLRLFFTTKWMTWRPNRAFCTTKYKIYTVDRVLVCYEDLCILQQKWPHEGFSWHNIQRWRYQ